MINILFGPPGTGKSTKLIEILEDEMGPKGVDPDRIAFVSFTRKAVQEVMERVKEQFCLESSDFPYFRTIHSLAYKCLGISHEEVMQNEHYKELGDLLGIDFSNNSDYEDGVSTSQFLGDRFVYIDGYARARNISYEEAWRKLRCDESMSWVLFEQFFNTLNAYKKERRMLDFCDFLSYQAEPLDIDVAIIDEAQDLSTLQWKFALNVFRRAKRVYIAGDDDQAIYNWSGADVRSFMNIPGDRTVLDQSYRIPRSVHRVAEDIASRINHRLPKEYKPSQREGNVEYHRYLDSVDVSSGTWLLLARNIYHLSHLSRLMKLQGYYYSYRGSSSVKTSHLKAIVAFEMWRKGQTPTIKEEELIESLMSEDRRKKWPNVVWHEALNLIHHEDREFYISLLRRGEKLKEEPRIHINTIHAVKGGEADNVLLMTDVVSRTYKGFFEQPDNEHRVWYVGATRCRESLHIVLPQTQLHYEI